MANSCSSPWAQRLSSLQIKREMYGKQISELTAQLDELSSQLESCKKAQAIVQSVAKSTQSALQISLSELCSVAMKSVFDNAYQLHVEFVERRGKTECDISFMRDGEKVDPLTSAGGGAVDIAALTLRLSLWGLMSRRTASVFVFDEPLKWLKGDELPQRGARLLSFLSEELGIQIIMVSHDDDLIEAADKVYRITNRNGKSVVEEIDA